MLLEQGLGGCVSLKRVYCGGEALEQGLVNEFYRQLPWARLYNLYGPTETTIDASWWECERREGDGGMARIGRGIGNMRMYVLDEEQELLPWGVAGELYIGGEGVARGYLNRGDLTAERFVPDGNGEGRGERIYRTGDLARWDKEGRLEFLGRVDRQVKLRGYRIELEEIEAVLRQHERVKEAGVIVREDRAGQQRLVGYVQVRRGEEEPREQRELRESREQRKEELKRHLRERLPEYRVPGEFVEVEKLPLLPNGKLDRKALQEMPGGEDGEGGKEYVGPRTVTEELLAGIWAQVLGVEKVSMHASFFDLGGHSLLATQVVARVRSSFGIELSLRTMFEASTVSAVATQVSLCTWRWFWMDSRARWWAGSWIAHWRAAWRWMLWKPLLQPGGRRLD